jgi:peptidoglycan hydrolase CwlO-like protein
MLTPEDIKNLTKYQTEVFKDVFATKKDMDTGFEKLDKKIIKLQTSVDAIAKDNLSKSQEMPVLNSRIKEVENWVDKAAPKLGIKFVH